ncbi:MAG: dipeptidase [Nocardioides sp.]|jgi:membrane dipeptidase
MADHLRHVTDILRRHPVLDGHNDLPWEARRVGYDFEALDLAAGTVGRTHTDLPRLHEGCVGGQFWSVFVPCSLKGAEAVRATHEQIDAVEEMARRWPGDLRLARTTDEVTRAFDDGMVASLLGAEGGHSINESLDELRSLFERGVRYLTLTHNSNTPWADSATDLPVLGGLSDFGHDVVREMNSLGMLVDLSHVSHDTMRDALATTSAPAIFSHSSTYALCDTPRNAPDDVLETLRDNGGVLMVTLVPYFLSQASRDWHVPLWEDMTRRGTIDDDDPAAYRAEVESWAASYGVRPDATIQDAVAHFEHAREVMGIDHLGIGGDYDGVDHLPLGLEDVSTYPLLFAALAERGWSDDDLAKVANRNVLRVLRAAEDAAD